MSAATIKAQKEVEAKMETDEITPDFDCRKARSLSKQGG
jgi:hypothetical protein